MIYNGDASIRLRLVENDDADFLLELRSDPEVITNLSSFVLLNPARQTNWINSLDAAADKKYLIFEQKSDQGWQKLGLARTDCIDYVNRSMRVGGDIHKAYRGKGYAKAMYELIFQLGFDVWNLHRLWLYVLSSNERGFNLYEKLGFQTEGSQKQAVYRNGAYIDQLMMSILQPDYRKMQQINLKEHQDEKYTAV